MSRTQMVTITKDGQEGQVLPAALPAWERNGWTRADDGSSSKASAKKAAAKKTAKKTAAPQADDKSEEG